MTTALTKGQRKIVVTAIAAAAVLFVFWLAFINPCAREIAGLTAEIGVVRSRIEQAEDTFGGSASFAENVARTQERLEELEKRLSGGRGTAEVLEIISLRARERGIEVISIKPGGTRAISVNGSGRPVSGKRTGRIQPIAIELDGKFRALGEYFGILEEELPVLFSWERVRMAKDERIYPRLNAEVVLFLYLFEEM